MNQCDVCKKILYQPKQCIVCNAFFCDTHIESFQSQNLGSESFQKESNVYICRDCLQYITRIKNKQKHLWSEEEKVKTKSMAGNIVKILGAAGIALVSAILFFALWLFKKTAKHATEDKGITDYEIEGHSFSEEDAKGFRSKFIEDNPSFEKESLFKEDEPFINDEQPLVEEETFSRNEI